MLAETRKLHASTDFGLSTFSQAKYLNTMTSRIDASVAFCINATAWITHARLFLHIA
jgi:hypothetical protein